MDVGSPISHPAQVVESIGKLLDAPRAPLPFVRFDVCQFADPFGAYNSDLGAVLLLFGSYKGTWKTITAFSEGV